MVIGKLAMYVFSPLDIYLERPCRAKITNAIETETVMTAAVLSTITSFHLQDWQKLPRHAYTD